MALKGSFGFRTQGQDMLMGKKQRREAATRERLFDAAEISNAILYWNTIKINDIVNDLRLRGEEIDPDILSHISLLPFKHVIPNGTFVQSQTGCGFVRL